MAQTTYRNLCQSRSLFISDFISNGIGRHSAQTFVLFMGTFIFGTRFVPFSRPFIHWNTKFTHTLARIPFHTVFLRILWRFIFWLFFSAFPSCSWIRALESLFIYGWCTRISKQWHYKNNRYLLINEQYTANTRKIAKKTEQKLNNKIWKHLINGSVAPKIPWHPTFSKLAKKSNKMTDILLHIDLLWDMPCCTAV